MPKIPLPLHILIVLIALIFILVGAAKLTTQQLMLDQFVHFGYATWFMYLVGLIEVMFGVGLLIPRLMKWSAMGLVPITIGAVVTHIINDPVAAAIPASALLMLLGYIVWRLTNLRLAALDPLA